MSAIGVAISPTAVFSGSVDGDWRVSLVNPQAIVHVVGRAVFAAFLKCFVATDQAMTLEQMLQLNSLHVAKEAAVGLVTAMNIQGPGTHSSGALISTRRTFGRDCV